MFLKTKRGVGYFINLKGRFKSLSTKKSFQFTLKGLNCIF